MGATALLCSAFCVLRSVCGYSMSVDVHDDDDDNDDDDHNNNHDD